MQEARACLDLEPGRSDLVMVLIRALWRSHQVAEARAALAALLGRQPLSLPANLLAALDAEVNGGDSIKPLAMARQRGPAFARRLPGARYQRVGAARPRPGDARPGRTDNSPRTTAAGRSP